MSASGTQLLPKHSSEAFNPDEYRMSIGDHLEDLRRRLILGLIGFVIAFAVCCVFGKQVIGVFCRPLVIAMRDAHVNPQIYYTEVADTFMVYMQISLITAAAIASPWMLYQLWQFVAAGLYPKERKYVTKYLPLSIALLVSGMAFLYFFVLPVSIEFFLRFSGELPLDLPTVHVSQADIPTTQPTVTIPLFAGDPPNPVERQIWVDASQQRLKMFLDGNVRVIPFGPEQLAAPMITLPRYIDMVVGMLIAFGVSFQLPLVVMALVRIGIVTVPQLKAFRKYVWFLMAVIAAIIIPDVVTGMIALTVPLVLLYELGIWLGARGSKNPESEPVA